MDQSLEPMDSPFISRHSRRGFLGFAGRVGVVVVGAAACVMETSRQAYATTAATWRCCELAFNQPNCPISNGSYYCTRGTMKTWCCCQGARTYACGECTGGIDCHHGPFYCSAGWTTAANSCVSGCPQGITPKADPNELALWQSGNYVVAPDPSTIQVGKQTSHKPR